MTYKLPDKDKKIYFIGIGGAGMSAIAYVLACKGYSVSGSDQRTNKMTMRIEKLGGKVFQGHNKENVKQSDIVVISTAIKKDNPEYAEAQKLCLPIWHRAEMLSAMMNEKTSIAIAGTHGKTTTTSMMSFLLEKAGVKPTSVIGGELDEIGGNSKLGEGEYLVAEADESDGSFLKMTPDYVIVTNIEPDHLDHYKNYNDIIDAFKQFLDKSSRSGKVFLCYDDIQLRKLGSDYENVVSYGLEYEECDIVAKNIQVTETGSEFDVIKNGKTLGKMKLNIPGIHNISNSLGVVGFALESGLDFEDITRLMSEYRGVGRRFQLKGRVYDISIYDDYAHHPTEIKATLKAAKEFVKQGSRRVIAVFEPHRYSRTFHLYKEFGESFIDADLMVLTDIYGAGETPIDNIDGELIYDEALKSGHQNVKYIKDKRDIPAYLLEIVKKGDIVITMGAGDIWRVGDKLLNGLEKKFGVGV